ncbi:serine hydrolase domain-containing protein [Actinoplanes sp. NPDC051346]|uniref:serine hydrolase domain-containing protein n=1 Tax=Actinoplanes sp. NPDC051346 TaxID=3155048 RepID=UPI003433FE6F
MRDLDELLAHEARRAGIPGAALVAWRDSHRYTAAFGVTSVEQPAPVTVDTPFRIGSTTKPLTTAAILALADDKVLDLDEPLPWGMTLRQLLSHTGGLPADPITPSNLYGPTAPDALRLWAGQPPALVSPPGQRWCYSNPGFALAAHAAELATGASIADLVDRHVLRPLGMRHTSWRLTDAITWTPAQCHVGDPPAVQRPAFDNAVYAAAGFAYSSASDLARFLTRVPEAMTVRHADTVDQELDGYGLGLYVGSRAGIARFGHPGGIQGSGCQLQATSDGLAGVALVYNLQPPGGWPFAASVLDAFLEASK